MWTKLAIWVPTVVVSLALTFAPVIAQETDDRDVGPRTTTAATDNDDDDGPELGWLGLIGLIGLAGLMRRDRDVHTHRDRDRVTHN
jgi:MYXO-CTERM domain-containing protein